MSPPFAPRGNPALSSAELGSFARIRSHSATSRKFGATAIAGSLTAGSDQVVVPQKISKSDLGGKIFERADVAEKTHGDGHKTQDVTTLVSSDKKFSSGMYKSSKVRFEITEPYGVDEFMYFLEGSVTLTSSDGTRSMSDPSSRSRACSSSRRFSLI